MEIDKLAFIFVKDKKVLSTLSKGKTAFYIPGGKRENGESDEEALIREVKEELSVELIPKTIKSCGIFKAQAHGKPEGTIIKMTCVTSKDMEMVSPVGKLILADLKKKNLID